MFTVNGSKISKPFASVIMVPLFVGIASFAHADDPMSHPINCATAEGDLRALESEKKHAQEQQLKGVTAITPSGAALGIITGTESKKLEWLSGDYIKKIDARIADTKKQCNL